MARAGRINMTTKALDSMLAHLEFLGYEVTQDGEIARAKHATRYNVSLRSFASGILLTRLFGANDTARQDKAGYLEFINSLNNKAAVARFYADKDMDLFIEAWYPDMYDRPSFGLFLEIWDRDCALMAESEAPKYLR
jgi:hypothetical protein